MGKRMVYTAVAASLTVVDGLVTVYFDWPRWRACSGDICGRGLLLATAALVAISIGNVWVQAISQFEVEFEIQGAPRRREPISLLTDTSGQANV